jgi:hypothetical protein
MPLVISGKVPGGETYIKHLHLPEASPNDILAGGYTNEMSGSITPLYEPWVAYFNFDRPMGSPVMWWGTRVTGLSRYSQVVGLYARASNHN